MNPATIAYNLIYISRPLVLIAVAPHWAVALKMQRYLKQDPADICVLLLRVIEYNNFNTGYQPFWTTGRLMNWMKKNCAGMHLGLEQAIREHLDQAVSSVHQAQCLMLNKQIHRQGGYIQTNVNMQQYPKGPWQNVAYQFYWRPWPQPADPPYYSLPAV